MRLALALPAIALIGCSPVEEVEQEPAADLTHSLPTGFILFDRAVIAIEQPSRQFHIVVALQTDDPLLSPESEEAPTRTLLIVEQMADGGLELRGRNDHIAYRANEGGQCDPFGSGRISTSGASFTIENSVACGHHWTSLRTFRFDPDEGGFVFDNSRYEEWIMNPDSGPSADALVLGSLHVERPEHGQIVRFSEWEHP